MLQSKESWEENINKAQKEQIYRSWDINNIASAWKELLTVLVADLLSRWIHFWFPAEIQGLWTKVPYMLCSLTWAYLFSLTLTLHVDVTLQHCVNSVEKGSAVGKRRKCTKPHVSFGVMLMLPWSNVLANNVKHFNLLDNPNPSSSAEVKLDWWNETVT